MTKIIVLGASGTLGKHVAQQAVDAGHEVSVVVRTPSKLPASWRDKVKVHKADIATLSANQLGALLGGHDVVINTAGSVSDGDRFVTLVAHIVNGLETIEPEIARWSGSWREQVCWTLAALGGPALSWRLSRRPTGRTVRTCNSSVHPTVAFCPPPPPPVVR